MARLVNFGGVQGETLPLNLNANGTSFGDRSAGFAKGELQYIVKNLMTAEHWDSG